MRLRPEVGWGTAKGLMLCKHSKSPHQDWQISQSKGSISVKQKVSYKLFKKVWQHRSKF